MKAIVMASDASQSILRMTLLALAVAAFMVVWAGDSGQTVGMTLAERNRRVTPGYAIASRHPRGDMRQKTARAPRIPNWTDATTAVPPTSHVEAGHPLNSLPGGSYRIVFDDGRVEWLTVIDRAAGPASPAPGVLTTTVNGQRAHLIRVSSRGGAESPLR